MGTIETMDARAELKAVSKLGWIYIGLVVFSLAGTCVSVFAKVNPGPIAPIASVLTILVGFSAVFEPTLRSTQVQAKTTLLAVLLLSALIECIGLVTGFPFGSYKYTDKWVPTVLLDTIQFPLMVPFAWLLVVGASTVLCSRVRLPLLAASIVATGIDFAMEPVMVQKLGYWHWDYPGPLPGGASVLNPVGWLLTSWLIARLVSLSPQENRTTAGLVLGGHCLLTLGIGLMSGISR
jgi:putative membrane protein